MRLLRISLAGGAHKMENQELLREYYNERVRGFAQRKFEELNEYQLKHLQNSFSFSYWKWSKSLDSGFKAIIKKLGGNG